VLHQIGVGALGPVFRTYEPTRDRLVAVKVFRLDITPEQARTLADELSKAADAGLFHPSIVEPIAGGVEGTVAYRAEEYVAAETLDVALRHYAPASMDKALPFITQLAGALDFARAAGVGHGALHPRDVFVTPEEARATGFGVVDALERVGLRAPVRRPYSAPERIEGAAWGTPADVFSLAAIAYELLTARRPSGTGAEIGPLTGATVGDHADSVLAVLVKAMDANPARRFPSALAFAGALEQAARGERPVASGPAVERVAAPVAVPAAPPPVAPPVAVPAAIAATPAVIDDDDISHERDEDEAHHDLLLREHADAAALEPLAAGEEDEPEADADRLMIAAAAAATATSPGRYRDDFTKPDSEPEIEDERAAVLPVGRAPVEGWAADRGRLFDSDAEYASVGTVVPAQRSRVLPLAAMLSIGLLVGFAVGYGVGARNPAVDPGATAANQSASPSTVPAPAGRDYSEQAVAQPRPGTGQQPTATPPPVPGYAPAPAAARPAATTGRLVIESIPSRAGVTVNGAWRGRTPLKVEKLPFGKYAVRIVQPGYAAARQDVALSPSDPAETVSVTLQRQAASPAPRPAPRPSPAVSETPESFSGTIFVDSRPRGARVFVDGRAVGTTPLSLPEVPIGSHVVRLELPEHRSWSSSTRVAAGQTARVTGSLDRIR
jgi:hypothetical protein